MEEKSKQESKGDCCQTSASDSGCCGSGKKMIIGILIGVILFLAGYGFAKLSMCGQSPFCPMKQYQK